MTKIYYCMMGFNRLNELKTLKTIDGLIEQVDQFIYVDGSEGKDGTYDWFKNNFPDKPILVVSSKWSDDFPGQRNNYLNLVGELRQPDEESWVIVNDTDEVFSDTLATNVRKIIDKSKDKTDMILVRCESITVDKDYKIVHSNLDDFYKPLIFKYYPGTEYWGDRSEVTNFKTALHESLQVNGKFKWKPIKLNDKDGLLIYKHIKLENIIWERGLRNFVVFGGGPNLGEKQPLWLPFRKMLSKYLGTDFTSTDVLSYFSKGNIAKEIKDWMIEHRDEYGYDGSSEIQECFKTYFILYHPEEMYSEETHK